MKLGEIKIEALKLMFINGSEVLLLDDLEDFESDDNYGFYLVKMNGAINRCFSDLEMKGVLPARVHVLTYAQARVYERIFSYDISAVPMTELLKVICENTKSGRRDVMDVDEVGYFPEEGEILLPPIDEDERYKLSYRPRIERLTVLSDDKAEIDVPEHIAAIIPLYIKGDLYAEDEPNAAAEARNQYEAACEQIKDSERSCASVNTVYALSEI